MKGMKTVQGMGEEKRTFETEDLGTVTAVIDGPFVVRFECGPGFWITPSTSLYPLLLDVYIQIFGDH